MTDLEAANRALTLLGVAPIGSLSEATQAARVISRLLGETKKAVFADYPWQSGENADMPENISAWPAPVTEYLVVRLASDAAMSLTGSAGIASMLWQKAAMLAGRAAEHSAVAGKPKTSPPMSYIAVR